MFKETLQKHIIQLNIGSIKMITTPMEHQTISKIKRVMNNANLEITLTKMQTKPMETQTCSKTRFVVNNNNLKIKCTKLSFKPISNHSKIVGKQTQNQQFQRNAIEPHHAFRIRFH